MKLSAGAHKSNIRCLIVHICSIMLLFALILSKIGDLDMITVMNDEFGYWSNAALVAGYDWKDLAMNTPYYSFGYSIVLIPLFLIFKSTATMYRAAIILNGIMLCVSYVCCYLTLRRIRYTVKDEYLAMISGAVMLMCGNLFYMKVAWCETFMTMLLWLMILLMGRLEEKFRYRDYVILHLLMLLMYITHQRAIGIFISLFAVMFLVLCKHKKKRLILITGLFIVGTYCAQKGVRIFQDALIDNSRLTNTNVLSVEADVIKDYADKVKENIIYFSQSVGGKLLYVLSATWGVLMVGAKVYLTELIKNIKEKKMSSGFLVKSFMVCSFVIMFGLNAVQAMTSYRWDIVVYSRYMEFTLLPVAAYSFMCFFEAPQRYIRWLFIGLFAAVPLYLLTERFVWSQYGEFFNITCSPLIGAFYQFGGREHLGMMKAFLLILITVMILMISVIREKNDTLRILPVLLMFVIFNIITCSYADKWLNGARDGFHKNTDPVYELLTEDHKKEELYFIKDDENNYCSPNVKFLQFMLGNREIHVIEDIEEVGEDAIVMINSNDELEDDTGCEEIGSTGYLTVYVYSVN